MKLIGLTGSIGMGKSTTAAMFREAGIPVYDADAAVHRAYDVGGSAVGPVGAAFEGVVRNGRIDREELRKRVLGDPKALKVLNGIVHPLIGHDRGAFFAEAEAAGADLVILDIPLIYETGGERNMAKVIVVSAPAEMQRERVLAREGMTPERLDAILAQQMPDAEKRKRADYVVDTGQGLDHARRQVEAIIADLRKADGSSRANTPG